MEGLLLVFHSFQLEEPMFSIGGFSSLPVTYNLGWYFPPYALITPKILGNFQTSVFSSLRYDSTLGMPIEVETYVWHLANLETTTRSV